MVHVFKAASLCKFLKSTRHLLQPVQAVFYSSTDVFPSVNKMPNEQETGEATNSTLQPAKLATFVKQETLHKEKWLSLEKVTYKDVNGRERTWEVVERTTKSSAHGVADGVAMVTVLKRLIHYDCILLVKQYRPPLKSYTIEFPAGLIDQGESAAEAAIRELKEETGYTGTVQSISPCVALDTGISSATINIVHMQIDGDDPVNKGPSPHLDDGERIEVFLVPFHKLCKKLEEISRSDVVIDARVYAYAAALDQSEAASKKKSVSSQ